MASAPARRAAYSISAATSVSRTPGRMVSSARSNRLGSQIDRRSKAGNLFLVLHHPGLLNQGRGLAQAETRGQRSSRAWIASPRSCARPRSQSWSAKPDGCSSVPDPVRGQPCGGCRQRPFARDHDLRPFHFGPRLPGIAPIGKEHPLLSCDNENAGAAGESAEIANIRRMGDQQRVQAMVGKRILQALLAASMVHPRSLATAWRGGHG